jgi:tetratricopeptide (TPR) repeat protein
VTDHWIRRTVTQDRLPLATSGDLEVVGGFAASDRDLGLAYAQMAARGDRPSALRALELLRNAEKQSTGAPLDHELHAQLGFLEQLNGEIQLAAAEYRQALAADPYDSLAAGDLAFIQARQGQYPEAIRLWDSVFTNDPVQLGAGLNLAVVECGAGQRAAALATLDRLLTFSPDNEEAKALANRIRSGKQNCGPE